MIKAWPANIHAHVLRWLNEIWDTKQVPDWWHYGHLRPIPKAGEPSLDNLRPLGLYEISQKILTAILTRRIYQLWETHRLLNDNQHAFRRNRSTSQAIIRLINLTEDAAERGIPQRIVQWGLALMRLGVPATLVLLVLYYHAGRFVFW